MPDRYHMIDYIHEGPEALRRTLEANERPVQDLAEAMARRGIERVILTGIGSSHTAMTMAAPLWAAHSRRAIASARSWTGRSFASRVRRRASGPSWM